MHSTRTRKKYATDLNRYLGVEFPEDRIGTIQRRPTAQRNPDSSFSIRNSLASMFTSTSKSVPDMAGRQSSSIRRWKSKYSTSAASPSTPLRDRTNTMKTSSASSTMNNTTFLPELYSTPPMPTFQKPAVPSLRNAGGAENITPSRAEGNGRRPDSETLPPIADPGRLLLNPGTMVGPALVSRVEDTPPLPAGWTQQHDRAICVLDARNYALPTIVAKIRRTFPGLRGILTPGMVDKRLRQLDQDVEIDYWRVGLQGASKTAAPGSVVSRVDSGSTLTTEGTASKVPEPTLKSTVSGSLAKSPSIGNLLPDTVFSSPEPTSRNNVTSQFLTGYRTQQTAHAF